MIEVQAGERLIGHADFHKVFRDWLSGRSPLGQAARELQDCLTPQAGLPSPGPIWSNAAWREAWLAEFLPDLPDDGARERALQDVQALLGGAADVVITGQQPGFLGGPLYTLYKAATAVVLAELRTAAGRRTVPVFWCADDDDDIREALLPVAWDPVRNVLLHHERHGHRGCPNDRMIGDLPASEIASGAEAWLGEIGRRNQLAADLAGIWREGVEGGHAWVRMQRRAMLRILSGSGILFVRGNDRFLHTAAAPFYDRLWRQRKGLREAARNGARHLAAAGYGAAVTEASIQRFLHRGKDGRRHPIAADHGDRLPDAGELRPGVVVRSCVQDWLFRPAGVVVGPGEAAYLKQLGPVYSELGLARSALVPRLFALAGPVGYGDFQALALDFACGQRSGADFDLHAAAQRLSGLHRNELLSVLHREADVPPERLMQLADQIQHRWGRYLTGILQRERRRSRVPAPGQPVWLRPGGRRQERALAAFAAAALWGDDFVQAVMHAARRHVDAGLDGDWREFLLTVPGA